MTPDEDGGETPCKIDVEYEWLPLKCTACMTLGHTAKDCALNKPHKPMKPPVNVYVPKVNIPTQQPPKKERKKPNTYYEVVEKADADDMHIKRNNSKHDERGKAVVIYNAFDALHLIDEADEHSGGPNTSSPLYNDPSLGDQFIHCRVTNMAVNESVIITVVYGASEVIDRRNLWIALRTLAQQCSDAPWLVGGDFNAIRDLNEVCGISGDIRMATEEFNAVHTRSLWKRLDRILINDRWLARFPTSSYHSLTPRTSDHSPLVLQGDTQQHNGGMFRFDNYLARSPEFIPNVHNIWHHEIVGVLMYAVTRKLKALKPVFRLQRRNKGDLTLNVQLAKGFLDEAQHFAKFEQIMLQQRAKMQWMKDGDQCSRVFFRKIAQRRVMRRILQINDENGTTHSDQEEIAHEFVSYYQNLLGGTRRRWTVNIQYLRPWARHCITDEEANHLLLPFSPDDVKKAVFDIAEDKAPGPDGYSSGFFKAAWPIVGEEVTWRC
ncbi:UNVERIFIED_CONTAM: hypothetical protein Sindi_1295100 [Sesamum indicum]